LLNLAISHGDVDRDRLTACQRDAVSGLYARALAAFIGALAPKFGDIRERLPAQLTKLREKARADDQHPRLPDIVASLALGLRYFFTFASEVGAISKSEAQQLWQRGWRALCEAAEAQAGHQDGADSTRQFPRLLAAALASGRAHVAGSEGMEPVTSPAAWGWRHDNGGHWQPQGRRIGWVDGEALYLEPDAAFAEAQKLAGEQGESLAVSPRTLWQRLKEKGLLVSWDESRQRNTVRRNLEGTTRTVLHLQVNVLAPKGPSTPSTNGNGHAMNPENTDVFSGRSDGRSGDSPERPSIETGQTSRESSPNGRCGRSDTGRDGFRENSFSTNQVGDLDEGSL
jgi:hypothetical protein